MKKLIFIFLLFLIGVGGFGQTIIQKTYGGSGDDERFGWGRWIQITY